MAIVMGRLKNKDNTRLPMLLAKYLNIYIYIYIKKSFEGIHDRFQKDSTFRESLLSTDRTEEICIQMDEVAQKDFTNRMSQDEYFRNNKWRISLNISGNSEPMKLRSDFSEALTKVWRRASRTDSFLAIQEMASVVFFFVQHILVAVERFLMKLMTINKMSGTSELVKEQNIERLLQSDPLRLTAVCCNRRGV